MFWRIIRVFTHKKRSCLTTAIPCLTRDLSLWCYVIRLKTYSLWTCFLIIFENKYKLKYLEINLPKAFFFTLQRWHILNQLEVQRMTTGICVERSRTLFRDLSCFFVVLELRYSHKRRDGASWCASAYLYSKWKYEGQKNFNGTIKSMAG